MESAYIRLPISPSY